MSIVYPIQIIILHYIRAYCMSIREILSFGGLVRVFPSYNFDGFNLNYQYMHTDLIILSCICPNNY